MMKNKTYDVLKWGALIALPALATFLGVILPEFKMDAETVKSVIVIINATGLFVGTLIGVSTKRHNVDLDKDIDLTSKEKTNGK